MKAGTKALRRLGAATSALTIIAFVPQFAGTAFAATPATGVTASPSTQNVNQAGSATINYTVTPATTTVSIDYAVIAGPNSNSSTPFAGTACSAPVAGAGTCTDTKTTNTGTDTVRVFADNAGTGTYQNGDPFQDVTVVVVGAPFRIAVTPTNNSAAQNTCTPNYTVTVTDSSDKPVPGSTVGLSATQTASSGSPSPKIAFCGVAGAGTQGGTPPTGTTTGATTNPTGNDGTTTFGVMSDTTGTVTITVSDGSAPAQTVTATITTGGADSVTKVALSPASQTAFTTKTVSVTYTLTNAQGDPVGKVAGSTAPTDEAVNGTVSSGPDAGAVLNCTTSGQGTSSTDVAGQGTCSFTAGSTAGTDNIQVWVNQTCGATLGHDACEPQGTAAATTQVEPTGQTLTFTCAGATSSSTACTVPANTTSTTVTATLTGTPPGGTNGPLQGFTLNFTVAANSPVGSTKYTISPASCTTDANGQCVVTLNDAAPANGDKATITGTESGDSAVTASVAVTWATAAPNTIAVTPAAQTLPQATTATFTVSVTDQFGKPSSGVLLTYVVCGRNNTTNNAGASGTATTGANGQATITYTDKGATIANGPSSGFTPTTSCPATTSDEDTLTVSSPGLTSGTANAYWVAGNAQANAVGLDISSNSSCTGSFTGTGSSQLPSGFQSNNTESDNGTPNNQVRCVQAVDQYGNILYGATATLSSTGEGTITDVNGTPITTVTIGSNGYGVFYTEAGAPGTQNVSATVNGITASGSVTYTGAFVPITPTRILDTRTGLGGVTGPVTPGHTIDFNPFTSGVVPAAASGGALAINVTVVGPTGAGDLRIFPQCSASQPNPPTTSTVNYNPNHATANFAIVSIPYCVTSGSFNNNNNFGNGEIGMLSDGSSTQVIFDVVGYYVHGTFSARSTLHMFNPPQRLVDTRNTGGPVGAGQSRSFQVSGFAGRCYDTDGDGTISSCTVPTPGAVLINVTAVAPSGTGNLRVYPDNGPGTKAPTTSNINYQPGQTTAVFDIVQVPSDGKIDVFSDGASTNVVIDVVGFVDSNSKLVTQTPVRVLDTRPTSHVGTLSGPLAANTTNPFQVGGQGNVPTNAEAVLVSLTAIAPAVGVGNLRLFPSDVSVPNASNVNYIGSNTIPNFAIMRLPVTGTLSLYSDGSPVNVAVDVLGWFPIGS